MVELPSNFAIGKGSCLPEIWNGEVARNSLVANSPPRSLLSDSSPESKPPLLKSPLRTVFPVRLTAEFAVSVAPGACCAATTFCAPGTPAAAGGGCAVSSGA
eukprot:3809759-Rhodomonas_salina.1